MCLWGDRADDLAALRLGERDLPAPLSVSDFVSSPPGEDLVGAMARAVAGGTVDARRNPLLFDIAAGNLRRAAAVAADDCPSAYSVVARCKDVLAKKGVTF